jgi:uncharacterized protein (DUF2141 family)
MKRKITLLTAGFAIWLSSGHAQSTCNSDPNGFVAGKNVGGTQTYDLISGFEEKASQTYKYNGVGKITGVKVYGHHPVNGNLSGVALKVGIYHVDATGKPTALISSVQEIWWSHSQNSPGYNTFSFPGGVTVSSNFAISVEVLANSFPYGDEFHVQYTGNGEGLGQDLASLAGTSTGNNWASAMTSFNRNGDFYLIPTMENTNISNFNLPTVCLQPGQAIQLVNTSSFVTDSMFNKLGRVNYSGLNYLYTWNFGDGSPVSHLKNPTHTFVNAGQYNITLTTTLEGWNTTCVKTTTKSITVGLSGTISSLTNVLCNGGNNGSFNVSGIFGTSPYSYSLNQGAWQSSGAFINLMSGTYDVRVKDFKGCIYETSLQISQPANVISLNTIQVTNGTCGQSNGSFVCNATGGVGTLMYKLNNGNFVSSGSFNGLVAGSYNLTVKDANGCTKTTVVTINSTTGPTLMSPNVINVSCFNGNDGSITLSSTGGSGASQYSINGINFQLSGSFTGLSAGTYACSVKDNANCSSFTTVTITQGAALNFTTSLTMLSCFGAADGAINVSAFGGTGSHSYSLNGINYQSTPEFTNLTAGNYTVYVKDVTSCIKSVVVTLTQPTLLITTLTSSPASCYGENDGSVLATSVGGIPDYFYSIDGTNFQDTGLFNNLYSDTIFIYTKDSKNCISIISTIVTQPSQLIATVNTTNATCSLSNGGIMAVASGGSGTGYMYSMNGINFVASGAFTGLSSGTQFVIIKDGANCTTTVSGTIISAGGPSIGSLSHQNVSCHDGHDGSITINNVTGGTGVIQYSINGTTFQNTPVFNNLSAGLFIAYVKDANACIDTMMRTLVQPNAFVVVTNVTNVLCHGAQTGAVAISASGGAGFFAYSLNSGFSFQSGTVFNALAAGNYSLMIKDAANCMATKNFTILEPTQIHIQASVLNVSCYGEANGEINMTASGGVAPYLYSLEPNSFSTLGQYDSLQGGVIYQLVVRDANNCIFSVYRFVSQPSMIQLNSSISDVSCYGGNNGSISILVNGGVSPYMYTWSNQAVSANLSNLEPGNYDVLVTDHNGCNGSMNFVIDEPASPLVLNNQLLHPTTSTSMDGEIDITITGGTAPYQVDWSNGSTQEDLSGVSAGSYIVTITDENGCSLSTLMILDESLAVAQLQEETILVYPNPSSSVVMIESKNQEVIDITITNAVGKIVHFQQGFSGANVVDVSSFAPGMYYFSIKLNDRVLVKKMEVSH